MSSVLLTAIAPDRVICHLYVPKPRFRVSGRFRTSFSECLD